METTTKEQEMPRRNFNLELIEGLYKIRNSYEVRDWLRQCVRLERKRRSK